MSAKSRRPREAITLRLAQIQRILGIHVRGNAPGRSLGLGQSRVAGRRGSGRSDSALLAARPDSRD